LWALSCNQRWDVGELNDILERLRASLGPLGEGPIELEGGITNRNFRVELGGRRYVVRRPGKDTKLLGIDRDGERIATQAAAELGVAPAVAASFADCLVTDFINCAALEPADVAADVEALAVTLRTVHDSPTQLPTEFRVSGLLDSYARVVQERGGTLPGPYAGAAALAARIEAAIGPAAARPCHNDLLAGNIIRALDGQRLMLVDWEYAAMGDPYFDLGNLSVNNDFDEATDERLLSAYHGAPPSPAQRAALKLARVLSDAREAAWGVVQQSLSELDFDFAGYASEHFERLEAAVEEQQLGELLETAARRHSGATA
jgi:thiamine kinase-like enzyme